MNKHWKPVLKTNPSFGFLKNECVWIKVRIPSNKINPSWYLEIPNSTIDSITCFQGTHLFQAGDRVTQWSIKSSYPTFPISDSLIYLRIKKKQSFLSVPMALISTQNWREKHDFELLKTCISIGVFAVFFIFNLILFLSNRKKVFGLFSLHVAVTVAYYLMSNGFLKTYLAPGFLYFSEIRLYLACSSPVSFYLFISHLLSTKEHSPKITKMGNYLALINASLIVLSLISFGFLSEFLAFETITTLYISDALLIVLLIIMSFRTIRFSTTVNRLSALIFLVSMGIILLLFSAETQLLHLLPRFDVLLIISAIEIVVFGVINAFNFFNAFKENEQLALSLLQERIEANKALTMGEVRERKRISTLLHDYYQSRLTAIRLMMMQGANSSKALEKDMLQLETDLRQFSHQLMPKELEEGQLLSALKERLNQIEKSHTSWKTELFSYDFPDFLKEEWVFDLFLILNELIQNSLKHSQGNELGVECYAYEEEFQFIVYDNGTGFSESMNETKGVGLKSIRERIAQCGGSIRFESVTEDGFSITIQIPRR
jgi:signal transduction histidine kinase